MDDAAATYAGALTHGSFGVRVTAGVAHAGESVPHGAIFYDRS